MEEPQKPTQDIEDLPVLQNCSIADPSRFDFSEDYYKSAVYFEKEFPQFPDEFYDILELYANGVTPKQFKLMRKKEKKKEARSQGKKTKNM